MSIPPPGPLAYEGAIAIPFIIRNFAPSSSNNTFGVPTIWIDPANEAAYMLVSKTLGVADWLSLGNAVQEIDTPDGTHVLPSAGVIAFANGTGMNITGSGNTITFNSSGGGLSWTDVSGVTQALAAGNGYVANNGAQIAFSLPATAAFGDFFIISGYGAGGWTISQGAGQSIIVGASTSTIGAGGSVSSTNRYDTIQILCVATNTGFKAVDWAGNLTVV